MNELKVDKYFEILISIGKDNIENISRYIENITGEEVRFAFSQKNDMTTTDISLDNLFNEENLIAERINKIEIKSGNLSGKYIYVSFCESWNNFRTRARVISSFSEDKTELLVSEIKEELGCRKSFLSFIFSLYEEKSESLFPVKVTTLLFLLLFLLVYTGAYHLLDYSSYSEVVIFIIISLAIAACIILWFLSGFIALAARDYCIQYYTIGLFKIGKCWKEYKKIEKRFLWMAIVVAIYLVFCLFSIFGGGVNFYI